MRLQGSTRLRAAQMDCRTSTPNLAIVSDDLERVAVERPVKYRVGRRTSAVAQVRYDEPLTAFAAICLCHSNRALQHPPLPASSPPPRLVAGNTTTAARAGRSEAPARTFPLAPATVAVYVLLPSAPPRSQQTLPPPPLHHRCFPRSAHNHTRVFIQASTNCSFHHILSTALPSSRLFQNHN